MPSEDESLAPLLLAEQPASASATAPVASAVRMRCLLEIVIPGIRARCPPEIRHRHTLDDMARRSRRATVKDVHELALGMPHVTVEQSGHKNPVYQVGGKSFIFFRTPRPDAFDPETGERYTDVIVFWVDSES